MLRHDWFVGTVMALLLAYPVAPAQAERPSLMAYRTRHCDCCPGWIGHLRQAGFAVRVLELPQLDSVQRTAGVPPELASCYIALLDRFSFSGHVPAEAIQKFIAAPGSWRGLAVLETLSGPLSAEMKGQDPQLYEIYAFGQDGRRELFARARNRELVQEGR